MEGTGTNRWHNQPSQGVVSSGSFDEEDAGDREPLRCKSDDNKPNLDWLPRIHQNRLGRLMREAVPYLFFIALVATAVWDMKAMKAMSDVIHNDHSNIWKPLEKDSMSQWFTRLDLCMLKVDKPGTDLKRYRQENCSRYTGGNGVVPNSLFCGIGSSLGRPCSTPLSTKPYYKAGLKDGDLIEPNNGYLKRALRRMAEVGKPLIFLGDVISKQNTEALICEILRTDRVSISGNPYDDRKWNTSLSNFSIYWKDSQLSLPVQYIHVARVHHVNEIEVSTADQIDPIDFMDNAFHKENSDEADSQTAIDYNSMHNRFGNSTSALGRLSYSVPLENVRELLNDLQIKHGGYVLIANIGVWYNTLEHFRMQLPGFMKFLEDVGKQNVVLFRETSAQHWNHTAFGYFENGASSEGSCTPLQDSRGDSDWRNREVRNVISNEFLEEIKIIPFRDVTAPLHQMHPDGDVSRDCTRFCYFPQMWQTVWRALDYATFNNSKFLNNSKLVGMKGMNRRDSSKSHVHYAGNTSQMSTGKASLTISKAYSVNQTKKKAAKAKAKSEMTNSTQSQNAKNDA